jgi:hypothetical protein
MSNLRLLLNESSSPGYSQELQRRQNISLKALAKSDLTAIKIIHEEPEMAKGSLRHHFGIRIPRMVGDAYRRLEALFLKVL